MPATHGLANAAGIAKAYSSIDSFPFASRPRAAASTDLGPSLATMAR